MTVSHPSECVRLVSDIGLLLPTAACFFSGFFLPSSPLLRLAKWVYRIGKPKSRNRQPDKLRDIQTARRRPRREKVGS
ncbi:MAG: hypothetical protein ABW321_10545 [Polyangiales bacterium]